MASHQQRNHSVRARRHTRLVWCCAFASVLVYADAWAAKTNSPKPAVAEQKEISAVAAPDIQLILALPEAWPAAKRDAMTRALRELTTLLPSALHTRIVVTDAQSNDASQSSLQHAIINAAEQWKPSTEATRSLIVVGSALATNHETDIDQSRRQLLSEWLPRLRQRGVRIYTVATDDHADEALLSQLAVASDGWFLPDTGANDLVERTMRAMEAIVPHDSLPIEDGLFKVDDQVRSVTLLLYRHDPNLPPRLTAPMSAPFSQFNAPNNVTWVTNDVYDLITINKPRVGTWQLDLVQPNNANVAFADAAMTIEITPVPRNILTSDQRVIHIELHKNGTRISDPAVLEQVALKTNLTNGNDMTRLWYPLDDGENGDTAAGDGIFTVVLNDELREGVFDLAVDVEGVSIKRRKQQRFVVHAFPAEQRLDAVRGGYVLSVVPRMKMIDPETFVAVAYLQMNDGSEATLPLARYTNSEWRASPRRDAKSLQINIQATSSAGKPISAWLNALALPEPSMVPEPATSHVSHETPHDNIMAGEADAGTHSMHDQAEPAITEPTMESARETSTSPEWLAPLKLVGTVNVLLGVLATATWLWFRRRSSKFTHKLWTEFTS